MSIVLRPHHLLCTQGYSGKGYDNDFVAHMTDVVHQLRDVPGTTIHLTFSTDTLCSCCPNKLGTDLCDTQEKVKRYDAKTVEILRPRGKGLRLSGPHPRDRRQSHAGDPRRHLPRLLLVPPISACCKNICEGRYVNKAIKNTGCCKMQHPVFLFYQAMNLSYRPNTKMNRTMRGRP